MGEFDNATGTERVNATGVSILKVFVVELLAALVASVYEANRQKKWRENSVATQVMVWFKNKVIEMEGNNF